MPVTQDYVIARVGAPEVPLLEAALRALATELGDDFSASHNALKEAVCGPQANCLALLAVQGNRAVGVVLATPLFSTMLGGTGLYVSDLWVASEARGKRLARRLLAAVLREGEHRNSSRFLKLSVYHDNPTARTAYESLGFAPHPGETNMVLTDRSLQTLKETL